MADIDVTTEGMLALLWKLNPQKATWPDDIPARILIEMAVHAFICALCTGGRSVPTVVVFLEFPDVGTTANIHNIFIGIK